MVFIKKVNNSDPGSSTKVGGDNWDTLDNYLDNVNYATAAKINTDTYFRENRLKIYNTGQTSSVQFTAPALSTNRTITIPDQNITLGTHNASHQSGGTDAIKLDDLAATDDNTDLDASITKHGLMKKYPNNGALFLDGTGTFSSPPGATGGEANAGVNLGSGVIVYKEKSGVNLNFKTLQSLTANLTVEANADGNHVDLNLGSGITTNTGTQTLSAKTLSGIKLARASITSATTLTATNLAVLASASGGAYDITLPVVSGNDGLFYIIQKTDSSVNAITINANASETINGQLTYVLTTQYQTVLLICDGTSWSASGQSSERTGKATATGDGSQTVYTFPHGLGVLPTNVMVQCSTHTISIIWSYDTTNITVTFTTAPANGTAIELHWRVC